MATAKKTTKKTASDTKEVAKNIETIEATEITKEEVVNETTESIVNTVVESETKIMATKPSKKKFEATEPINCISIASGDLGMIGIKSGINYTWAGRGDETEVEYQDLVSAVRSGKSHIYKPYFIIDNEDFLKEFPQVKKVYSAMYSIQDLRDILVKMTPAQIKTVISTLPEGAKESVKHIASNMISTGALDSVAKIKVLDEIYDTKFMLMTELFNA